VCFIFENDFHLRLNKFHFARLCQGNIRHYSERVKWSQSGFFSAATLLQLKMKVTAMTLLQNPFKMKADLLGGSEGSFVTV
jgi:hypothetical protein